MALAISLGASPVAFGQATAATTTTSVAEGIQNLAAESEAPDTSTKTPSFIKGDLVNVGVREIVSPRDHAGVRIGPAIISKDLYLAVTPNLGMYWEKFSLGFQVPLNLLLVESGSLDFGGFQIRKQDWDEASDYAKFIRFITYGEKESSVYFTVDSLRTVTIGHGELINRYQGSIDIDRVLTGVELDMYNKYAGFQLSFNDITARGQILGALAFVKPFGWASHWLARSFSLGLEYAADFKAPRCVQVSIDDRRCVQGSGNLAGPDPITGVERDDTFVRTDPDTGRPVVQEVALHALGFSTELRVFEADRSNIKLYGTFHKFLEHGGGIATGLLSRVTTGSSTQHAFRLRGEFRTFDYDYLPSYFDTLYEVTKYQYSQQSTDYQITPTKYQAAFGDPDNGFVIADQDRRFGFSFDLNYGIYGEADNKLLAIGLGLDNSSAPDSASFYAHLEAYPIKYFQIFGSFMRLNMTDMGDIFSTSGGDNIVVLSGARVQILPVLFLNVYYSKAFQVVRSPGLEFHLGNDQIVDEAGEVSPYFASDQIYENVEKLMFEIELGWEFKD